MFNPVPGGSPSFNHCTRIWWNSPTTWSLEPPCLLCILSPVPDAVTSQLSTVHAGGFICIRISVPNQLVKHGNFPECWKMRGRGSIVGSLSRCENKLFRGEAVISFLPLNCWQSKQNSVKVGPPSPCSINFLSIVEGDHFIDKSKCHIKTSPEP